MKKSGIIILITVSTIILLSIVQTVLSNRLSTSGVSMSKINKEIRAYKTENTEIREKLFLRASLNNIAAQAMELGFIESKSQLVVSTSLSLAARQ